MELVYAQQQVAAEEAKELESKRTRQTDELEMLRAGGPAEKPPYSFLLLDDLNEELAGEQARRRAAEAEVETAKQYLDSVRRSYEEGERRRRAAREAYETNQKPQATAELKADLEAAELYSQVVEEAQRLKAVEIENARQRLAINEVRVTFLSEKIAAVAKHAVFSRQELDAALAQLKKQEDEFKQELDRTQTNLRQAEQQWWEAKQQRDGAAGDRSVLQEQLGFWQQAQEASKLELSLLNERLREFVITRNLWNDRYQLVNQLVAAKDLPALRQRLQESAERFRRDRELLDLRLEEARLDLAAQQKRLQLAREAQSPTLPWLERQVQGRGQSVQMLAVHLSRIEAAERLVKKMLTEAGDPTARNSSHAWAADTWQLLQTCWQCELTSIDDQPITVGKVVGGAILLLIGYVLSRRMSRLLGGRVLPRFGMNEGVSSALQTIAFYLLLATFGFFTLELLHIPVTVFAFMGGAIAIGIGFGSQNVLNNFISGLILLAERPIRVGDLVEIDGLQGNVEQIGARSTRIKTGANLEIIVPNSKFLENNVTNWTLSDTRVRTSVCVGVDYGSPTREVARLLLQAVESHPSILQQPEPLVLFQGFGDNTLDFEVYFWVSMRTTTQRLRVESEVRYTVDDLLRQANISIAFPQRDVHLDTSRPLEIRLQREEDSLSGVPSRVNRAA